MEKILKTAVKVAAVLWTAPATLSVAGMIYPDPWWHRFLAQAAGLVLVEGALLLGWWLLDNNSRASPAQRFLYAGLTIVAYIALLVIGWRHGEGTAGIVFRATLAVLIFYSLFEAGILAQIRLQRNADRDINRHRAVKRYKRRKDIEIAKLEIDVWSAGRKDELQLESERNSKWRKQEHSNQLQRLRDQSTPSHSKSTPSQSPNGTPDRAKKVKSRAQKTKIHSKSELSKEERLELLSEFVDSNPELQPSDYVEWAQLQLGVAESTAWNYWSELKPELVENGFRA